MKEAFPLTGQSNHYKADRLSTYICFSNVLLQDFGKAIGYVDLIPQAF